MPPTKSPKIIGLREIHSPKALWQWGGLSFCLWCGKEGQKEGMVVNHLQTSHYHLGLVYSCCMEYFTMSTNAMCQHSQLCKWHWLLLTMIMTRRRNLMVMTMAENMMMSSHSMRININMLTSCPEQSRWDCHSTLVLMPGQASLTGLPDILTHPFMHSTQMQWGTLPQVTDVTIQYQLVQFCKVSSIYLSNKIVLKC